MFLCLSVFFWTLSADIFHSASGYLKLMLNSSLQQHGCSYLLHQSFYKYFRNLNLKKNYITIFWFNTDHHGNIDPLPDTVDDPKYQYLHDNVQSVVMLWRPLWLPYLFVQENELYDTVALFFFTCRYCTDNFMPLLLINTSQSHCGDFAEKNLPGFPSVRRSVIRRSTSATST